MPPLAPILRAMGSRRPRRIEKRRFDAGRRSTEGRLELQGVDYLRGPPPRKEERAADSAPRRALEKINIGGNIEGVVKDAKMAVRERI